MGLGSLLHRRHRSAPHRGSGVPTERVAERGAAQDLTLVDGFNGRFSLLIAGPSFGAHVFSRTFRALQIAGAKILDLTAAGAEAVGVDFFEGLTRAWFAPAGRAPRVAVVLPFDRWALLRDAAAPCVAALAARGTEMALFYREQGSRALALWFTDGVIRHDVELAIQSLLCASWTPTVGWPLVVATAAELARRETRPADTPRLLASLSAIALGCGNPQIAERLAREALALAGLAPSVSRALALRTLGAILIARGRGRKGIQALGLAIATAERCDDSPALTAALCHLGMYHVADGDHRSAERCFRRVIEISMRRGKDGTMASVAHLGLAVVMRRRGQDQAAAIHAAKAHEVPINPETFAEVDSHLLAELHDQPDRLN